MKIFRGVTKLSYTARAWCSFTSAGNKQWLAASVKRSIWQVLCAPRFADFSDFIDAVYNTLFHQVLTGWSQSCLSSPVRKNCCPKSTIISCLGVVINSWLQSGLNCLLVYFINDHIKGVITIIILSYLYLSCVHDALCHHVIKPKCMYVVCTVLRMYVWVIMYICVRISYEYILRLISRPDTEDSPVFSLISDCWLLPWIWVHGIVLLLQ